ncbi:cytochrome c oxidase subunit II [Pseudahrensia aquimaris]|uniref:Cytochrome c oxidase subunit 2 n=1 Tax=Pseudahrensia aquimaris TaxID=744461 RepID=A0ABW3FER7_9HYPH
MHNPTAKLGRLFGATALFSTFVATAAQAAQPTDWQIWHQTPGSSGMEDILSFSWLTLYVIVPITLFVMGLLAYVVVKFSAKANPTPSKVTHNTTIEVIWTVGPILVLLILAIPSFKLLESQFNPPEEPSITIKATGYQWYWNYEYQGEQEVSFDSRPIGSEEIAGSKEAALKERTDLGKTDLKVYPNLLAVDNEVVVPVGKVVRVLVTAGDVIHNWAMPAFGKKMDGYPGRLNETFFQPLREGIYYGQCSELCGKYHAFMPIGVRVVSQEQYDAWLARAAEDVGAANQELKASIELQNDKIKVADNKAQSND